MLFSTSKRFEMNSDEIFHTILKQTLLLKLYTPDVIRNSRICYNGNNIFRANSLLTDKTQQVRFLFLKFQVQLPDNGNMR